MQHLTATTYSIQPDRTIEAKALFGQATMKLQDDLYLTLGTRHSEDEKSDVGGKNYECSCLE